MHLSNTFYCSQATDLAATKVKLTEYWVSLFTNLVLAVDSECMQKTTTKQQQTNSITVTLTFTGRHISVTVIQAPVRISRQGGREGMYT